MELPNLPGFKARKFTEQIQFARKSIPLQPKEKDTTGLINHQARDSETGLTSGNEWNTTHQTAYPPPSRQGPAKLHRGNPRDKWLRFDRVVLRCFMYFREAVHESALEVQRVRSCTLLYFLADDSVQIVEPRQENSGIAQGPFLQKTPLRELIEDTDFESCKLSPKNLKVGTDLTLLGRTFRIVDCDQHTRSFCQRELGFEQPIAEEYPEATENLVKKPVRVSRPKQRSVAKLGGRVLNFFAVWDGTGEPFGEKRYFTIHCFLADNTIEIREQHQPNSGRGKFPVFLTRCSVQHASAVPPRPVTALDITCGSDIILLGRKFGILSCDTKTREYYSKLGIDQIKLSHEELEKLKPVKRSNVGGPVRNGAKLTEEGEGLLFGNGLSDIMPRHEKTAIIARIAKNSEPNENQSITEDMLRFMCKLVTESPYDKDREFVITFFNKDATLNIYEPPRRNSGVIGGKFLERGAYRNEATGEQFTANDFALPLKLGAAQPITIMRRNFFIIGADSVTRRYFTDVETRMGETSCEPILDRIVEQLAKCVPKPDLRNLVEINQRNGVPLSQLKEQLANIGILLEEEDMNLLQVKYPSVQGSNAILYNDLCDDLSSKIIPCNVEQATTDANIVHEMLVCAGENRKLFRSFDSDYTGELSFKEIQQFVAKLGYNGASPYDITELMKKFDPNQTGKMQYNALCDQVKSCVVPVCGGKEELIREATVA